MLVRSDKTPDDNANAGQGGGICDIDPKACPTIDAPKRAHALSPQLVAIRDQNRARAEQARILEAHRNLCAHGNASECMRNVELELMRFPYAVLFEERSQGSPPAFDAMTATHDLCTAGNPDACTYLAGLDGDVATAVRACDLGAPRGCAIAALRIGRNGPDSQRTAAMLGRACAGGVRWACALR
jgi:hypothetical protein